MTRSAEIFNKKNILLRAAKHVGLEINKNLKSNDVKTNSAAIRVYKLDEKILTNLTHIGGFEKRICPDTSEKDFYVLVDTKNQKNWWRLSQNRELEEKNLQAIIKVELEINAVKRCVEFKPLIETPLNHVKADMGAHFRLFKTLIKFENGIHTILKDLSKSDGSIAISFDELGLHGIKIAELKNSQLS